MSLADTLRYLQELPTARRQPYLEAALQEDHSGVQTAVVRWLLQPGAGRRPDLVVDHFGALPLPLQQELSAQRDELLAVAREKIVGGRDPRRLAAFQLVAALGDLGSAEVLVLGIADANDAVADTALAGLVVRLRSYAQARREALEQARDGVPVARDAAQEAAWQALATALRNCPDARAEALCAVLFEFGVVSMSLFRGVLVTKPEAAICRAFVGRLGTGPAPASAQFVVQLALDGDANLQRIGQQVLRDRRDPEFGREVAREIAAVRDDRSLAMVRNLRDVPWWGTVQYVLPGLDGDTARRLIAVVAELRLEPPKRQAHLEAFLAHEDGDVQAAAVKALHAQGCPAGIEAVARVLRSGAVVAQRAAVRLVIDLVPAQRVALLTPLLGSGDVELRQLAVREVSKISFKRYLERFDQMDEATRAIAAKALAKIDNQMLDRLAEEIGALDPSRRLKALRIVDVLDAGQELQKPLLELLDDPDRRVRATAIRIVELSGSYEGVKVLLAALSDPDRRVRANAVEAFEELADPRFVQILVPVLRDRDNRVRANAAKALWQLGWPEARDVMLAMLQDQDEMVRLSAVWAIGESQFAGARAALEAREAVEPAGRVRVKLREVLAEWPSSAEVPS
ncbi:MAG: HEAT repeat domain-containing protein [Planctomycetes bacterium]|nr:HEAT repeat domain-containing protein [Planctomycetota bacterium]